MFIKRILGLGLLGFCLLASGAQAASKKASAKNKAGVEADAGAGKKSKKKGDSDKTSKGKKSSGTISSQEELDAALQDAVAGLKPTLKLKLGGDLKGVDIKSLIAASSASGALASYTVTTNAGKGSAELALVYHDGTRIGAALKDSSMKKLLTSEEKQALETLQTRMDALLQTADGQELSDYDKLVAIHDDIINHARYVVNDRTKPGSVADFVNSGEGLCAGYTRLMKVMLDSQNIPNITVVGESKGPHTWNLVYVEGAWRHVDVTWDDPIVQPGEEGKLLYDYLGLSDKSLSRDHTWDKSLLPPVTEDAPLYLSRNGQYCTNYADFWKAAEAAAAKGDEKVFKCYLENFGDSAQMRREYENYRNAGGSLQLRSTKCPQGESSGTVILEFP